MRWVEVWIRTCSLHLGALSSTGQLWPSPLQQEKIAEIQIADDLSLTNSAPYSPDRGHAELFHSLVKYIAEAGVAGDYVETGVYQGDTAAIAGAALHKYGLIPGKRLWLYDAWRGMPQVSQNDGPFASQFEGWGGEAAHVHALRKIRRSGINITRDVVVRKGWFNETFKLPIPLQVAFLHVDSDWYRSVMDSLETFYAAVAHGGVVLFDDFGYWEGCRRAFFDFIASHGLAPLVERAGYDRLFFIKGKEHNRASIAA